MGPHPKPLSERFWKHVKKTPSCWIWTGWKMRGYGHISDESGKDVRAHRIAWILEHGPIPENLHILHHCDNPACVNSKHLFLGTHTDNMRDMNSKGRGKYLKGEDHGNSRFKISQIKKMRELYDSGHFTSYKLAKIFKTSQGTIFGIVSRKSWKHIP